MQLRANAPICPNSRRLLVERIESKGGRGRWWPKPPVTDRTPYRWRRRFRHEVEAALRANRRPRTAARVPRHSSGLRSLLQYAVCAWPRRPRPPRCSGWPSPAVSAVLRRISLGKRLASRRLGRPTAMSDGRPGGPVHVDVKKLGRITRPATGSAARPHQAPAGEARPARVEFVHVCVDDCSRLAYAEPLRANRYYGRLPAPSSGVV